MNDARNRTLGRSFLIISVLGALYLAAEAVLLTFGTSICATEGCKVVAQYARFGDRSFVLAGLAVLLLLAVLAWQGRDDESVGVGRVMNALLIAALTAEGFLVGYQLLWLSTVCVFCLSVFGIFATLSALRAAAGHREVLAGFGALALLLLLFLVILPAGGPRLPGDAKLILFYSTECKHCSEIRKEIDASGLEVEHVLIRGYASTLKGIGIEDVPTLLVNGPYEKIFLTGTAAIRKYLASCRDDRTARTPVPRTGGPSQPAAAGGTTSAAEPFTLFPAPGAPGSILNPLPDDGLCKEEQKCD
jgi:hypothetical protein